MPKVRRSIFNVQFRKSASRTDSSRGEHSRAERRTREVFRRSNGKLCVHFRWHAHRPAGLCIDRAPQGPSL